MLLRSRNIDAQPAHVLCACTGTFAYAAPELLTGFKCNVKADIWCAACLCSVCHTVQQQALCCSTALEAM